MAEIEIGADIEMVQRALADEACVNVRLPGNGRLYIDRPLPFVCLYRKPLGRSDEVSDRLVTTQASYAIAPGDQSCHRSVVEVIEAVSDSMIDRFGSFLILEIWCRSREQEAGDPYDMQPEFRIVAPESDRLGSTIEALANGLERISIQHFGTQVHVTNTDQHGPPGLASVRDALTDARALFFGLEVEPVYRRPDGTGIYPFLFDRMRTGLGGALQKAFYTFSRDAAGLEAPGYRALGRRALEPAVREVDQGLSHVNESFDFLLHTTPINAHEAWMDFKESACEREPVFRYRPLPIDPTLLKRRLYALPLEHVEDPSLRWIFSEKQEELDRQITMLSDRDSRQFFFESLQLYGEVGKPLLDEARDLLEQLPASDYDLDSTEHLDAQAFAEVAAADLSHYRRDCPDFPETVHIRHDVPAGLMVSRGRLFIGHGTKIPADRVDALLHHEIGTHMLTYFNGRAQPLRILRNGLARYESLQEGLAVLSEYLVGGLNVPRLRVLAARVISAHCMIEGSSFVDLYRLLRREYAFEEHEAYSITLRTFRCGGLIKDVIYLRGLHEVMHYVQDGGDFDVLFTGKMALHHVPFLEELEARGILRDVPLRPRYLADERTETRLEGVKKGSTFIDLIEHRAP